MFEGLDDIPWHELEHAYGTAGDVPNLVRQLAIGDPKIRERAMYALYGNVFHQGTRYPATPFVIPFLRELCESDSTFNRAELLSFWASLITGYFTIQERPCWGDGTNIYFCGEIQEVEANDPYNDALHEIYRRSLAAEDLFVKLLSHDDLAIRANAAGVLACLPTIASRSIPKLRNQLQQEKSDQVRAAIAFALGEVGDIPTLRGLLTNQADPATRCMAACELARLAPSAELAIHLMDSISEPPEGYSNVPGAGGDAAGDAAFSIALLPLQTRREAIPAICEQLKTARSFSTMPYVQTLLAAAFEPQSEPLTELNSLQKQVMIQLVDCQELWSIANLRYAFAGYGLSHDRSKCAALAGVKVATSESLSKLSIGVLFSEMGFHEKARQEIDQALKLDPAIFAQAPSPDECWLFCAKAFAETDGPRALMALENARILNSKIVHRISPTWRLAELIAGSQA